MGIQEAILKNPLTTAIILEGGVEEVINVTDIADLNARKEGIVLGDELGRSTEIVAKILRLILDGDFETVQLDDNPTKLIKIRSSSQLTYKWTMIRYA